ncbi:MAG TPA: SpoIIE family protein phosphatase [Gemmatimonadales bacterium]|nr:SpoIIE family protein phosphatase [Gemmatimonadales bacterium]
MAAVNVMIDTAFAELTLPGQAESGDLCLIKRVGRGTLLAVADGLGHGEEAASAAHAAVAAIDRFARAPLVELVKRCHEALVGMRGVVLGLAFLDPQAASMQWLGVGNIGGVLLHADTRARPPRVSLVPNAGFIGAEPPHATARAVPLAARDTIILYSDGIKDGFAESLVLANSPQEIADFIIARHTKGTDDALALVARYGG